MRRSSVGPDFALLVFSQPAVTKAPLTGRLFDAAGEVMSPAFSRGRSDRVYRYYVSASLQQGGAKDNCDIVRRLPAPAIEKIVGEALKRWMPQTKDHLDLVLSVRLGEHGMDIELPDKFAAGIASHLSDGERVVHSAARICRVHLPLALPLRGGRRLIAPGSRAAAQPDPVLISALRRAHQMVARDRTGMPVVETAPTSPYLRKIMQLAFLAPDIQQGIMAGRQPPTLNLQQIMELRLPLSWEEQRETLNWPAENQPVPTNNRPDMPIKPPVMAD